VHKQRLVDGLREHAEMADIVGVVHEDAVGEYVACSWGLQRSGGRVRISDVLSRATR
jgi:hypothetical protein